jgi:hypothetical protein
MPLGNFGTAGVPPVLFCENKEPVFFERKSGRDARAPSARRRALFGNLPFEFKRPRRQFAVARLGEESIEPAAMIDTAERIGGNPKSHRSTERIRNQSDVYEVRQKAPFGLDVRVTDLMADLRRLAGQFAPP